MRFELFMRKHYQWDDQFDMEPQYSQLDMEHAFINGVQIERERCTKIMNDLCECHRYEQIVTEIRGRSEYEMSKV